MWEERNNDDDDTQEQNTDAAGLPAMAARQDYTTMPNHVAEQSRLVDIGGYMSGSRAVYEVTFD